MKTKKDQTIEAIEKLINLRYVNGISIICPLCFIHSDFSFVNPCPGCPNNVFIGERFFRRCDNSKTFILWIKDKNIVSVERAEFWRQALPTLKVLPNEAFTKKGYRHKYFKFLIDIDNKIMNK